MLTRFLISHLEKGDNMEQRIVYEVRAVIPKDAESSSVVSASEIKKAEQTSKPTNEIVSQDISKGFKKTVAAAATIYATSQMVVNPIIRENVNRATVAGDYVQAASIQRSQAIVNKSVGIGLEVAGIVGGFLVNPVLGGVALLGSVAKHTQQHIAREQNNRALRASNNIDNYINSYESARFIDVKAGR